MKQILCGLIALLVLAGAYEASSEEGPVDVRKRMQEAMSLTEHHKGLARYRGEWDLSMEIVGMGKTPGTAKADWLFEGRWIKLEVDVPSMMGMPFKGFVIIGYDKVKKAYVTLAVDNMSPGTKNLMGPVVDAKGALQVQYGEHDEYVTGELDKPIKAVTRWISDDEWVFEVWDLGIGESGKAVIKEHFTRKKK